MSDEPKLLEDIRLIRARVEEMRARCDELMTAPGIADGWVAERVADAGYTLGLLLPLLDEARTALNDIKERLP